jgi:hypothetical protein
MKTTTVAPGATVTITITPSIGPYMSFWGVDETFPEGWTFVNSTVWGHTTAFTPIPVDVISK